MDERRRSIFLHGLCGRIGSGAAPIVVDLRRPADLDDELVASTRGQVERVLADPLRKSSPIVYCGNVQQVSEGFAIALRAMGVEANFLPVDIALPAASAKREDN
jgi:hypothetical protein